MHCTALHCTALIYLHWQWTDERTDKWTDWHINGWTCISSPLFCTSSPPCTSSFTWISPTAWWCTKYVQTNNPKGNTSLNGQKSPEHFARYLDCLARVAFDTQPVGDAQIYTDMYCTVIYCNVMYHTAMFCTIMNCIVMYCTVMYCTVMYCTALHINKL